MLTAAQMEMATYTRADAFGPAGVRTTIGDVPVTIARDPHGHIVVTDDRGTHHDFQGATWAEIARSMGEYFDLVESGR